MKMLLKKKLMNHKRIMNREKKRENPLKKKLKTPTVCIILFEKT